MQNHMTYQLDALRSQTTTTNVVGLATLDWTGPDDPDNPRNSLSPVAHSLL